MAVGASSVPVTNRLTGQRPQPFATARQAASTTALEIAALPPKTLSESQWVAPGSDGQLPQDAPEPPGMGKTPA